KSPDVTIPQLNIVSADAVLVNGGRKETILNQADSDIEREILEIVWDQFDNIREFGSLIQIEEEIDEVLNEKVEEIESTGQTEFTESGKLAKQASVVAFDDSEETESWEQIKSQLLSQVSALSEEALEHDDPVEEMFVGEVEKSVRLLDLLIDQYDVVVSNPPYLGSSKMDSELKEFVKENYLGSRDLSTAFIERCTQFAGEDKYVTMVTPESFMFQYSYRKLRKSLLTDEQFIEGAHLSRYSFDQAKDSYTIPFTLRNSSPSGSQISRFYRLSHEQEKYSEYQDKIDGLAEVTRSNRRSVDHNDVY
ncbi:MAG: Eco57I restriction-modification methylase domain-containing protein, partial [Halobacteriaceae archaeon]